MALFYCYGEEASKLSLSGGKMTGDIDMSLGAIKNVGAANDPGDLDVITKRILEETYLVN